MEVFTKDSLIEKLKEISAMGWIENARPDNHGGVGNTIEDFLGIKENNLPIPNAAEWELKCQRINTSSLTTLFHIEPSPRAVKFVPEILLPNYGWKHNLAGSKYQPEEKSFRQTISGLCRTDRGFGVIVDRQHLKVIISFDYLSVDERHTDWLKSVESRVGLSELNPQPYWGFDDLFHKAGTKLLNCFYVQASCQKKNKKEYFKYEKILMLQKLNLDKFLTAIEKGCIYIDFDARTGHNHGTKFRLKQNCLPELYEKVMVIS